MNVHETCKCKWASNEFYCNLSTSTVESYCCAERCNICWNLPVIVSDTSINLSTQFVRHVSTFESKRSFIRSVMQVSQHVSVNWWIWQHNISLCTATAWHTPQPNLLKITDGLILFSADIRISKIYADNRKYG